MPARLRSPWPAAILLRHFSDSPALVHAPRGARPNDVPGPDPRAAALLGRSRLRDPAAVRSRSRRWNISQRDLPARAGPRAMERRLRAAIATPDGRTLWRQPVPVAALLPVPGRHQAV